MANEKVKIIMLACICPGSSSADHTINTLRYAERLKEKNSIIQAYPPSPTHKDRPKLMHQNRSLKL